MKNRTFRSLDRASRQRPRRRGRSRLFVLGAAFMASTAVSGLATSAHAQARRAAGAATSTASESTAALDDTVASRIRRFDLAPGPLGTVVEHFQRIASIRVTFANEMIRELPSPGVTGEMTSLQALQQLLAGTSVGFVATAGNAVTLEIRTAENVTVTSRAASIQSPTFTQPLRDIPQTIAVIPNEIIRSQGATTLRDVLRNVPGITFQAGEGGGGLPGDTFTLRGFSAGNDMFIDGLRDPGGYSRDAFNLEQVEVAKGPSSSIAGRGTTGGAINQVTKAPQLRESRIATIGIGNAEYRRGTIDVNQPVGDASRGAALRINAMWTDAGVPGRDVVENASRGVAPSLAFGLGKPTAVVLKYQHLTQDNVPDYGLPWGSSPGFPTGAFRASPSVDQSNFYGLRNYDYEDIRSDVATAEVSHRVSSVMTLRNVTRYSDTDRDSAITSPRPPNRQLQRRTMGNGNLANQTSLNASIGLGRIRHDLATGVEVGRETTTNRNSAQTTNQPQVDIRNPNPGDTPFGPMPVNSGNPSRTRLNLAGLYLFDTVSLGEHWQLTGGARWDRVDVDYTLTTLASGELTRLQRSDSMVSWRGGLVFKPRPAGSVYVGYGTSFNPSVDAGATGAALSATTTAANNPALEPEETRNVEAGTKWDLLGNRLSLTSAVFHTEKVNARTRNATNDPFVLAGRQRVQGIELGVSGSITERWTALAAYTLMRSQITSSANLAEEEMNLALTPESSFSAWTTFDLPWEVTVGGGVQYMDAVFRNSTNTTVVPSYWLANGLVSYRIKG